MVPSTTKWHILPHKSGWLAHRSNPELQEFLYIKRWIINREITAIVSSKSSDPKIFSKLIWGNWKIQEVQRYQFGPEPNEKLIHQYSSKNAFLSFYVTIRLHYGSISKTFYPTRNFVSFYLIIG